MLRAPFRRSLVLLGHKAYDDLENYGRPRQVKIVTGMLNYVPVTTIYILYQD